MIVVMRPERLMIWFDHVSGQCFSVCLEMFAILPRIHLFLLYIAVCSRRSIEGELYMWSGSYDVPCGWTVIFRRRYVCRDR